MQVKITKKHIMKGIGMDAEFCPIALALKEKTHKRVLVNIAKDIVIGETDYRVINPKVASKVDKFIHRFDKGFRNSLSPFSFELVPA